VLLRLARREPSAVLLFAQLAAVLVYPFLEDNHAGRAIFSALGVAILGLVFMAVRASSAHTWVALVLGLPATVLLTVQAITGDDALLPYSSALEALLYFYAAGALIAYMLADHVITRDEVWAIGATFTLLAWAFAYVFTVVQAADPGSFTAAVDPEADRSWMELLFDITPIHGFARSVVMIAELVGLGYVVLLVSRLLGLMLLTARTRE
jgi:hypothetical protein